MALSAFDDKAHPPEAERLKEVLGKAAALWDRLEAHVMKTHPPIEEKWNFSGAKYGWSMRLVCKKRVVLYMTPQSGCFLAGIVLGERAARAAHEIPLPEKVLSLIDAAPRYAEGRGIRLPVKTRGDLLAVQQLAGVKMAH